MVENSKNFKIVTAYNEIHVHASRERLEFRSGENALQSIIDLENPHHLELKNLEYLMAVLLFIPDPERILMLGTAAGSLLHFLKYHYPEARITAVDIDTELIDQLLQRKILPPAQAGLSYVYDDAAHYIAHCDQHYDLVLVDIFTGAQSPGWLRDKENINHLYRLLTRRGAVAYNLLIDSEHDFKRFYRTLRLVFSEQALCLPVEGFENSIVYGIRRTDPARDMPGYMQQAMEMSARLGIDLIQVLSVIYNSNPVGRGVI